MTTTSTTGTKILITPNPGVLSSHLRSYYHNSKVSAEVALEYAIKDVKAGVTLIHTEIVKRPYA